MAIQNHPDLYTAGAVRFDATPSVNLYGQLMAKKQAKMEALDEYDRQRINSINPQGVRDVDRQRFDQRINDIRGYYNINKDKIRRGNSAEAYEYEKMFRDVNQFVNQSKERTAKQDAAIKFYQEKLKQDGVVPDDFMTELSMNDKPIDEEGSASFNLTKWLSSPKPFNAQAYLKKYADVKRTPGAATYAAIPGQPLLQTETIEEKFAPESKSVIAARAANDYENSYSFRSQVQNEIKDPVRRSELSTVFKNEFGIDAMQPEDYATAFTLELMQPTIVKSKPVANKEAIMDKQQRNKQANIRLASALGVGAWKDKYTFDKIATEQGVNRNDLTVTDLIKNATGSDGQLNIEPSLLGLPDYAQNLKISADGKQISYDVTYDGGEVKTTTVTSEAPKKFMSNKLDLKVVPVTPSQNVRLPKNIKKTKVEKREFVFPNGKTSF